MKQRFLLLFLMVAFYGYSQDKEFGVMLGTTYYMGDLTNTAIKLKETKLGGGILFRYYFNPHLDFKVNLLYGNISGADSLKPGSFDNSNNTTGGKWAKYRNLSFTSYILDLSLEMEYNILPFISGSEKHNWTPYLVGGMTVFSFNPRAEYKGIWYDLQPLCTEGEGTNSPHAQPKYKLTQFAIPYGIGIKYSFKKPKTDKKLNLYLWNIGLECSNRKTFTDHLDDVGGYYPDYKILLATLGPVNGPIAVALSDRQGEALARLVKPGDAVPGRTPGTLRGDIRIIKINICFLELLLAKHSDVKLVLFSKKDFM